jgi:hypothetical protein
VVKIGIFFREEIASSGGGVHSRRAKNFKAVHILLTITAFRPASGLRLEIGINIDKKKSEFYFLMPIKNILTEKANRHRPGHRNFGQQAKLTATAHARIFPLFARETPLPL